MQLYEQGRFGLDDPAEPYLPELANQTFASWIRVAGWLRQLDKLRAAAYGTHGPAANPSASVCAPVVEDPPKG